MKSTFVVMICALLRMVSGEYFDDYCAKPIGSIHPGENQGILCVVKFPVISNDITRAMSLCEENSPYNVRDAYAEDKHTVCKYERPNLKCDETEAAFDDRCVTVRGLGPFSKHKEGCGHRYQLHVLTDKMVWIWASVFFSPKGLYLWAAIDNDFASDMDLKEEPKKRRKKKKQGDEAQKEQEQEEQDEDWRPVKIQTRTVYPYEAGTLFIADPTQKFPYLCSRPSMYYARGIEYLVSDARTLGFIVIEAKDKNGRLRPFLLYDNVFNVKIKSRYEVDYSDFKDVCNVFPNGYVASREDFYDQNEYMKVYEKEIPADHWSSGYPMNMCADTPRITAVMTPHGYRDMTAIARLPLICTFGTPPDFKTATDDDICNKAAHFDHSLNRCVCNDPSSDATVKEPGKWAGYLPMVAFVKRAFGYLWNTARLGVVKFWTNVADVLPLGNYDNNYLQSLDMGTPDLIIGGTRLDRAMTEGQRLLSSEPDDTIKTVIIVSDGDSQGENWVQICQDVARDLLIFDRDLHEPINATQILIGQDILFRPTYNTEQKDPTTKQELSWSKKNTRIVYVEVGILSPHVNEILAVSPSHKLFPIANFDELDEVFKDVMKEICTPQL